MRTLGRLLLLLAGVLLTARPAPAERFLPFGTEGMTIPDPLIRNPATPRLVSLIASQLQVETSPSRRARLVRDLGMTARAEAVEPVIASLRDPQPMVRASAVASLRQLEAKGSIDALRPLLNDPDGAVRVAAYRTMVEWDASLVDALAPASIDPLEACLSRSTGPTTREATRIAGAMASLSASQQPTALRQLARHRSAEHVPLAVTFLKSPRVANVVAALEVIGANGTADDGAAVRPLLTHAHPRVRATALTTLDKLGTEDRGEVALRALDDEDLEVRVSACRVLARSPSAVSVPKLSQQLDDGYPPLRYAAREALLAAGQAGIPSVVEQAVILLQQDHPRRQEDGSYLLGQLRREEALQRHIELTRSPDVVTAGQAARSLTRIGRREAGPAMIDLCKRMLRQRSTPGAALAGRDAIVAAAELGARDILGVTTRIIPQIEDQPSEMRAAAAYAAGLLGDPADERLIDVLRARLTDELETSEVQFESAKALGALKASSIVPLLRDLGGGSFDPSLRYMAHVAADHIEGRKTPFVPMTVEKPLETVVEELHTTPEPTAIPAVRP